MGCPALDLAGCWVELGLSVETEISGRTLADWYYMGPWGLWWFNVLHSALPLQRLRPDTWPEHQDPFRHTAASVGGSPAEVSGGCDSLRSRTLAAEVLGSTPPSHSFAALSLSRKASGDQGRYNSNSRCSWQCSETWRSISLEQEASSIQDRPMNLATPWGLGVTLFYELLFKLSFLFLLDCFSFVSAFPHFSN